MKLNLFKFCYYFILLFSPQFSQAYVPKTTNMFTDNKNALGSVCTFNFPDNRYSCEFENNMEASGDIPRNLYPPINSDIMSILKISESESTQSFPVMGIEEQFELSFYKNSKQAVQAMKDMISAKLKDTLLSSEAVLRLSNQPVEWRQIFFTECSEFYTEALKRHDQQAADQYRKASLELLFFDDLDLSQTQTGAPSPYSFFVKLYQFHYLEAMEKLLPKSPSEEGGEAVFILLDLIELAEKFEIMKHQPKIATLLAHTHIWLSQLSQGPNSKVHLELALLLVNRHDPLHNTIREQLRDIGDPTDTNYNDTNLTVGSRFSM